MNKVTTSLLSLKRSNRFIELAEVIARTFSLECRRLSVMNVPRVRLFASRVEVRPYLETLNLESNLRIPSSKTPHSAWEGHGVGGLVVWRIRLERNFN